jgi:hypothetical protein
LSRSVRDQIPRIPEHLVGWKHCTLTLHVKAADFASPSFYPRMLRCCEQDVLQCSEVPGKQPKQFAEHGIGLGRRECATDPHGNSEPKKE